MDVCGQRSYKTFTKKSVTEYISMRIGEVYCDEYLKEKISNIKA